MYPILRMKMQTTKRLGSFYTSCQYSHLLLKEIYLHYSNISKYLEGFCCFKRNSTSMKC